MQGWRPPQAWFALNIRQRFENIAEIHSEPFFPLPQRQGQNSSPQHHGQQMEAKISKLWRFFLLLSILESVQEVKEGRTLGEDEKREGKLKGLVVAENSQRGPKFKEQVTSMWYDVLSWGRDAFGRVYNNIERWNPLQCFHTGFRCLLIASPSSLILSLFLLVPSFGCGIQPTQTFEDHITYSKAPDLPSLRFPGPLLFLRPGA